KATGRSLERPQQFSIGWTTLPNVDQSGRPSLRLWGETLSDADTATEQFWPTIAQHGFGYNLIVPERVTRHKAATFKRQFGEAWTSEVDAAAAANRLFVIDMSRFQLLRPRIVQGAPRFTPATVTLLAQDARTKALKPIAIAVSGNRGSGRRMYTRAN